MLRDQLNEALNKIIKVKSIPYEDIKVGDLLGINMDFNKGLLSGDFQWTVRVKRISNKGLGYVHVVKDLARGTYTSGVLEEIRYLPKDTYNKEWTARRLQIK